MPINSLTAVETEYATRRDQIRAYSPAQLNSDLAGLENAATFVDEAVMLYRGRQALCGQAADLGALDAQIEAMRSVSGLFRAAVAAIKAGIPD